MAFGGLLDGFLAEKSFDQPRRGRHVRMEVNPRRSLTGSESDKLTVKKLSTVSMPLPKYSWPMMVSRGKFNFSSVLACMSLCKDIGA
ncbi:hypothetical protein Aduo_004031 [Ancylostoma duodenale]